MQKKRKRQKKENKDFELDKDPKKMSIKELVAVSNRGKPGYISIYRKFGVYCFIKPLLQSNIKPNHVTAIRIVLTIIALAMVFIPNTTLHLIALIILHFTIVLDKLDGPLARFTQQCTVLGKYLDVFMDHTVSSVLFFLITGLISYQFSGNSIYLGLMFVPIIVNQLLAYTRTSLIAYNIKLNKKWEEALFSDNLIFIMNVLTLAIIIQFWIPNTIILALYFFAFHALIKLILQIVYIVARSGKNPFSIRRIIAYFYLVLSLGCWMCGWKKQHLKIKKQLQKKYKKDNTVKDVMNIIDRN